MKSRSLCSFVLLGLGLASAAVACAPSVGLGSDDPNPNADSARQDAGEADRADSGPEQPCESCTDASIDAPLTPTEYPRIDILLSSSTRADMAPNASPDDASYLTVTYFKTPAQLSPGVGDPGCSERILTSRPPTVEQGITTFGPTIGTVRVAGGNPVPLALNPAVAESYVAELGRLAEGAELTVTLDATAKSIGGRTFTMTVRTLRRAQTVFPEPASLPVAAGQPLSLDWLPVEGPLSWSVSDRDRVDGFGSHFIDCWSAAGLQTRTDVTASDMDKLHWSTENGPKNGNVIVAATKAETSLEPDGTTLNVLTRAWSTGDLKVQP